MNNSTGPKVSLFSSHGSVLLYLSGHVDCTIRELAWACDLTERRIVQILKELAEAGMITLSKQGKRNQYAINADASCRHPSLDDVSIGDVLSAVSHPAQVAKPRRMPAHLLHSLLLPAATAPGTLLALFPSLV